MTRRPQDQLPQYAAPGRRGYASRLLLCALLLSGTAGAQPPAPKATAAPEPMTRIRGVPRTVELTPEQFAGWMHKVWRKGKPSKYAAAGIAMPPTPAEEFRLADTNRDGRVTKDELADYLALPTTN